MKPTIKPSPCLGPERLALPVPLKRLALIVALKTGWLTVGATAQVAFEVGGAGVIGDSVLTVSAGIAKPPVVGDSWKTNGGIAPSGEVVASTLIGPAVAVPAAGNVTLTFTHRHDFESGWDGGAVLVSVNGNPAFYLEGTAFTSGGYVGPTTGNNSAAWAGGENVFYGQSAGYGTPAYITSVANLGPLDAGDTVSVQFRGEWEQQQTNGPPAWEISTVKLTDAAATDFLDLDFSADGPSGFTVANTGTVTGPWANNNASVLRFELNATAKTADRLVPESTPAVIDITGATIDVAVLTGELEIGDTYSLINLSGGSTLSGTFAAVTLPPNSTWDTSKLETNGTITVTDLEFKNGTWISDGDANWTDPANWLDGTIANGPGKTAFFTAELTTATRIVSLNGENRSIGHIVFTDGTTNSNNLTVTGNTLTLQTNSGTPTVNVTQSGRTLAISSNVAASQGILKTGPGTFQLGQTSSSALTGSIRVDAGTLFMSNTSNVASAASIILNGGGFRVSPGANVSTSRPFEITENGGRLSKGATHNLGFNSTFALSGSGDRTLVLENNGAAGSGQINSVLSDPGTGTLSIQKTGSLTWALNAANTFSGATTISAGILSLANASALQFSHIDTAASVTGTATAGLRTTGANLNLGGLSGDKNLASIYTSTTGGYASVTAISLNTAATKSVSYAASIAGAGSLTKSGAGNQTFTGAHTYTGATNINAGTLSLGAAGTISASSSVSLAAGATLDVSAKASYAMVGSQPFVIGIDFADSGSSGRINAAELNIANAAVTYNITGPLDDAVYVIATYTNLVGTQFASVPAPPSGYTLNYAYQGDKIALVQSGGGSPFGTWSDGAPADEDSNGDGVPNAIAWVLGAADPAANALGLLPLIDNTSDPDYLLFTFDRLDEANVDPATAILVQYGTNLGGWSTAVHDGNNVIINVAEDTPSDTVTIKFKRSTLAPNGMLFARVSVAVATP